MSNPDKRWSKGAALGRATGPAIGGGAVGFYMGMLGGPAGAAMGAAVCAAGGFASGFLGYALGHWWDEPAPQPESFGSAALYTIVISGFLLVTLSSIAATAILAAPSPDTALFTLSSICGFLGAASRSLIDDWRAQRVHAWPVG